MPVCWHLDDLKVSHVDPNEVNNFMECLESIYGDLRITSSKLQENLRTPLNFRTQGEIWINRVEYLKGVLEDFLEVIIERSTIPESNNLFKARSEDDHTLLDKEWSTESHHTVA